MEDLRSPEGPEAKTPAPPDQPGEDNPTIIYRIEKILPEALKALIPGGAEPSAEKPQNPEVKTITSSPASAEPVADEKEPEKPAGPKVILVKQPDAPAEPETPAAEEPAAQKQLSNREVTDHTAGLWNYLPIPENEPEPAPEYLKCNLAYPGAHVIGARVRGKKHKHEGSNCDDWFEAAAYGDATFLAVSDGAGSKKFSRIGAKESCKAATGFLREGYAELLSADPELPEKLKLEISDERCMTACRQIAELVQKAVIQAWKAVESAFYSRAADPAFEAVLGRKLLLSDLSGTLLVAAIIPVRKETKEHLIVTCQIGDGMIATVNAKGTFAGSVKLLGVPDSGEFTGETEFLTSAKMAKIEELQKRTKLSRGPVDFVMVMCDGVADDYFPNETQMRRLYYDLIANGILLKQHARDLSDLNREDLELFAKVPEPIAYPWVNDKSVFIPIQYTSKICEAMGLSLEDLWDRREVLSYAAVKLKGENMPAATEDRLLQWLDNYYERGSFDDRALVIAEL